MPMPEPDCVSEYSIDGDVQGPLGPSFIPASGASSEWSLIDFISVPTADWEDDALLIALPGFDGFWLWPDGSGMDW